MLLSRHLTRLVLDGWVWLETGRRLTPDSGRGLEGRLVQVADRFMYQAFEADGLPSALWVIHLDPRGASSVVRRCKQAGTCARGGVGHVGR